MKKKLKEKEQKKAQESKKSNMQTHSEDENHKENTESQPSHDNENVPYYTKLRHLKESKKRYENIFNEKRRGLLQIESIDHIKYDYSKIQSRMAMANVIEASLLDTLKVQDKQGSFRKFTLV